MFKPYHILADISISAWLETDEINFSKKNYKKEEKCNWMERASKTKYLRSGQLIKGIVMIKAIKCLFHSIWHFTY